MGRGRRLCAALRRCVHALLLAVFFTSATLFLHALHQPLGPPPALNAANAFRNEDALRNGLLADSVRPVDAYPSASQPTDELGDAPPASLQQIDAPAYHDDAPGRRGLRAARVIPDVTQRDTLAVTQEREARTREHPAYGGPEDTPPPQEDYPTSLRPASPHEGRKLDVEELFIAVKTTRKYHRERLDPILDTWFNLAREQTYFFTDGEEDEEYQRRTGDHMVATNCSEGHDRKALNCKMGVELSMFLQSNKSWFCHFDDDNYVHVTSLVDFLGRHAPNKSWYFGRRSTRRPVSVTLRGDQGEKPKTVKFWFATGGAGVCLSRGLGLRLSPWTRAGGLSRAGDQLRLPDDVTLGYLVTHLAGSDVTLTQAPGFHSHLEVLRLLRPRDYHKQLSFSYDLKDGQRNVLEIPPLDASDVTRFRALHCLLYPAFDICRKGAVQSPPSNT